MFRLDRCCAPVGSYGGAEQGRNARHHRISVADVEQHEGSRVARLHFFLMAACRYHLGRAPIGAAAWVNSGVYGSLVSPRLQ
jgi:hypothetical protein